MGPEPYGLAVREGAWSRPVMSYVTTSAVPTLHQQVRFQGICIARRAAAALSMEYPHVCAREPPPAMHMFVFFGPIIVRLAMQTELLNGRSQYVITGGTGGLGLLFAGWMTQGGGRHFTLLGRSGRAANMAEMAHLLSGDAEVCKSGLRSFSLFRKSPHELKLLGSWKQHIIAAAVDGDGGIGGCIQGHVSFLVSWAHSGWSFVCADLHRAGGPNDRTGGGRGSGGDRRQRRPPGGRHPRRWRTGGIFFKHADSACVEVRTVRRPASYPM